MSIKVDFGNPFVLVLLIGTLASFVLNQFMEYIDYKARLLNGGKVPEELADIASAKAFDTEKLAKICQYENAKYFVWIPSSILNLLLDLALVISICF